MDARDRSLRKKGISTFIATLLLIVLVVAAGVVIYAYTMGYLGAFSVNTKTGTLQVQSVAEFNGDLHIYAKNIGGGSATLDPSGFYLNDARLGDKDNPGFTTSPAGYVVAEGVTVDIMVSLDSLPTSLNGKTSTFKIVTVGGGFATTSTKINGATGGTGGGNIAPTAEFHWTTVGLTATFTDASTDNDGSVASWTWAFGDGGTSTVRNPPAHTYASAGTYTVTLTVKDNDGASSVPVSHDVNFAPAVLDHFAFDTIGSQVPSVQFSITVTAIDQYGGTFTTYTGTPTLTYSAGSISPTSISVTNGVGSTMVTVTATGTNVHITAADGSTTGQSNDFTVSTVQYLVTFTQTGIDSSAGSNTVLTIGSMNYIYNALPTSVYVDSGTTFSWASKVLGESGKQFVQTGSSGISPITASGTYSATYKTQYQVTFSAGTGGYITTPMTNQQWYDAGVSGQSIVATKSSGYTFSTWGSPPSIVIATPTSASTTMTVNGAGIVTAAFTANTPVPTTIRPNAAGSTTQLNAQGTGSANWDRVDEVTADGTTTYVRGTNDGGWQWDSYNIPDQTLSGTITSVTIYINTQRGSGNDNSAVSAYTVVRLGGGTQKTGTQHDSLPNTWTTYNDQYNTKPSELGGGAWTWADVNSLEIGVGLRSRDGGTWDGNWAYAQCTQVWVVVTYIPN